MQDRQFYTRVFALVSLGALVVGSFWMLRPFLGPLLWAALLAVMLFPANLRVRRLLRGRKSGAALLLTFAVLLGIVIPAALAIGLFVTQASDLITRLHKVAADYRIARPSDVLDIPAINGLIRWFSERLPISTEQVRTWLVDGGGQLLQSALQLSGSLFAGALGWFVNVGLALFLFFFFVRDGDEILARLLRMVPLDDQRKAPLVAHLSSVMTAVVLGSLATAIVQGTLVAIAFAIAGLPAPIVFGSLAMVASLIPVVGSALVWAPAALLLLSQGSWGWAIFLTAWGVGVVSSADNVVRPLFISSRARISTLPVFIGLLGGVSAFGAIGMFLGPVLVALVLALAGFWEELHEDDRPKIVI